MKVLHITLKGVEAWWAHVVSDMFKGDIYQTARFHIHQKTHRRKTHGSSTSPPQKRRPQKPSFSLNEAFTNETCTLPKNNISPPWKQAWPPKGKTDSYSNNMHFQVLLLMVQKSGDHHLACMKPVVNNGINYHINRWCLFQGMYSLGQPTSGTNPWGKPTLWSWFGWSS